MAETSKTFEVILRMRDQFTREAQKVNRSLSSMRRAFNMLKGVVAAVGVYLGARGLVQTLKDLVQAAAEQEQAERKLQQALQTTGQYSRDAMEDLKKYASQLQAVTIYGDEATLQAMALLQSLTQLDREGLKRAMKATADLAAGMGMDLVQAASLVGKSIGSTVNALSRYGIQMTDSADKTERLASLVTEIETKFGGMAEALTETTAGALQQFSNLVGDAKEQLGALILNATNAPEAIRLMSAVLVQLNEDLAQTQVSLIDLSAWLYQWMIGVAKFKLVWTKGVGAIEPFEKMVTIAQTYHDLTLQIKNAKEEVYQRAYEIYRLEKQHGELTKEQYATLTEDEIKVLSLLHARDQILQDLEVLQGKISQIQDETVRRAAEWGLQLTMSYMKLQKLPPILKDIKDTTQDTSDKTQDVAEGTEGVNEALEEELQKLYEATQYYKDIHALQLFEQAFYQWRETHDIGWLAVLTEMRDKHKEIVDVWLRAHKEEAEEIKAIWEGTAGVWDGISDYILLANEHLDGALRKAKELKGELKIIVKEPKDRAKEGFKETEREFKDTVGNMRDEWFSFTQTIKSMFINALADAFTEGKLDWDNFLKSLERTLWQRGFEWLFNLMFSPATEAAQAAGEAAGGSFLSGFTSTLQGSWGFFATAIGAFTLHFIRAEDKFIEETQANLENLYRQWNELLGPEGYEAYLRRLRQYAAWAEAYGEHIPQAMTREEFEEWLRSVTQGTWQGPAGAAPALPGFQAGAYFTQPATIIAKVAETEPEFILPESKLRRIIREEIGNPLINITVHTHDPTTWIEAWGTREVRVLQRKLERGG